MADDFQISTLNMAKVNPGLGAPEGFAYAAPYLYVAPHNGYIIAKVDTRSFTVVDTLDLSKVSPTLIALLGCFIVDGFLYILPHLSATGPTYQSDVVRVDLANFTPSGCSTLKVFDANKTLNGLNGCTDGTYGYLNMHVGGRVLVTRFGLGGNFNAASISSVSIPTIEGMPVVQASLVSADAKGVYSFAKVQTSQGTGHNDQQSDLWLVTIPTANFTAEAATFQRLTNVHYLRAAIPMGIDDGENLWCPPMPIPTGPLAGKFVGVIKVPKANPAAAEVFQGPPSQPYPSVAWVSGNAVYDGWRYGYVPSSSAQQIMQLDFHNPGVVNIIDITAHAGGYPMWGLGYDGHWAYAASYNGGAGTLLRFLPTQSPTAN